MPDAFAPGPSQPSTAPLFAGAALLDAEKLDAYRVALEFQALAAQLVPKRGCAELRDQLDRASISIVLNIAEGCGRRSPAERPGFIRWRAAARPSAPPSWTCSQCEDSSMNASASAPALFSYAWCRCSRGWSPGWQPRTYRSHELRLLLLSSYAV